MSHSFLSNLKKPFRAHLLQMTSVDDVLSNQQQITNLFSQLNLTEPLDHIIFLPENALYMRIKEGQAILGLTLDAEIFKFLQQLADTHLCYFHIGSSPLVKASKLVNASIWIAPHQPPKITYEKAHLFDIKLANQKPICESDVFAAGDTLQLLNFKNWKWGQSICYDLRFSYLFDRYQMAGADVLLIPASFLVETGIAHWHTLIRARAIETQCYVLAAAQCGKHQSDSSSRFTYGHSLIVDPWGQIIAEGSADQIQVLSALIDPLKLEQVRQQIPVQSHRITNLQLNSIQLS